MSDGMMLSKKLQLFKFSYLVFERFVRAKTVETGLFDFHKMVVSVFKTSFKNQKPKIVTYRDYKRFDNEKFRESLITCFSTGKNLSYDAFENLVLQTLDKMAPIKQKHIRGNQYPFMNKDIHQDKMTRTRLRNRYLKDPPRSKDKGITVFH